MKFKKLFFIIFAIFIVLGLASCSSESSLGGGNFGNNNVVIDTTNKIVYTVDYKIYSKDINEKITTIGSWLRTYEGYISDSEQSDDSYATYVYKIPTDKLNQFLDNVDSLEGITNKSISTEDVTLEYNEVEARIEMLEARKQAYINTLTNETLTQSEIIEINRLLDELEVKLISAKKELAQLNNKVDYSTVTIRYYKSSNTEIKQFIDNYCSYIVGIGKILCSVVLYSIPFAIVAAIISAIVVFYRKKKNNKEI